VKFARKAQSYILPFPFAAFPFALIRWSLYREFSSSHIGGVSKPSMSPLHDWYTGDGCSGMLAVLDELSSLIPLPLALPEGLNAGT